MASIDGKILLRPGYGVVTSLQFADIAPSRLNVAVPPQGVGIFCDRLHPNEWPEHRHDSTEVLIALEAAQCAVSWRSTSGRKSRQGLEAGDLLFIPAGISHSKRWLNESCVILLYLGAAWLEQFDQGAWAGVAAESVRDLTLHDPLVGALIQVIERHLQPHAASQAGHIAAAGHCLATRILHSLTKRKVGPRGHQRQLSAETLQRITTYVETNLGDRITMATLSREARLSPGHFGVLFKATVGMTPEQYILRMRLHKAKELIVTGAYTVGEAAYLTGFADHSHLSVQFRRLFGAPPRSYLPTVRTT